MKKRNAFTLVELLGVIVVLAIFALITIPIISNVINDVRIKSLENSAYGLVEASNLYYAQYGTNSNLRFNITGNKVESKDTDKLLTYKGSVKEGTVILDKKGKVTVCITDGKNSAYKNYNETKVTTVKGKCEIKDNSSIVYLDDEATLSELSLAELTEKVLNLENNFLDKTYPVGSVYTSFEDDTVAKVEDRFGGTWEQLENGYMLQSTSSTSNQKGGSSTATFTPNGTVGDTSLDVSQMPAHTHTRGTMNIVGNFTHRYLYDTTYGYQTIIRDETDAFYHWYDNTITGFYPLSTGRWTSNTYSRVLKFDASRSWTGETSSVGGNQSHTHTFTGNQTTINTVPPYITVYMYKRVS